MAKKTVKMRIDSERCKGCVLCVGVCPVKALEVSSEVNERGVQPVILKHPEKCTGCGLCALMCPDCAIEIDEGEGEG